MPSTTISFHVEGERVPCVKCGSQSLIATTDPGLCLKCSGALDTPAQRSKRGKLQYCGKPFPCGSIPPGVCEPCTTRTPMQRHCNYMLFMRRLMGSIVKAFDIEFEPWPKYARIGTTTMRLRDDYYWRDNGSWGCDAERRKGILVANSPKMGSQLDGRPVVEITKEEWEKENGER